MEKDFYSVDELSPILRLHNKTVQRFIREGRIKGRKIGRNWMVHKDDLADFIRREDADPDHSQDDGTGRSREAVNVTAVIEVTGQRADAAARISTSILAALAAPDPSRGNVGFNFSRQESTATTRFSFTGSPDFIIQTMNLFKSIQESIDTDAEAAAKESK